jgi:hypothetical protein
VIITMQKLERLKNLIGSADGPYILGMNAGVLRPAG